MIAIEELSADRSHEWLMPAVAVYVTAMRYPAGTEQHRAPLWREHLSRPEWQAFGAYHDGRLVGVVYGYRGGNDQWWNRQLRAGLRAAAVPPAHIDSLASDYYELTELHVHPDYQGHGLGDVLLRHLLAPRADSRILLSTPEVAGEDNRAWRLYRRSGFTDLVRNFQFLGDPRPFAILQRPPLIGPAATGTEAHSTNSHPADVPRPSAQPSERPSR